MILDTKATDGMEETDVKQEPLFQSTIGDGNLLQALKNDQVCCNYLYLLIIIYDFASFLFLIFLRIPHFFSFQPIVILIFNNFLIEVPQSNLACSFLTLFPKEAFRENTKKIFFWLIFLVFDPFGIS